MDQIVNQMTPAKQAEIAVLIPCYNEALTIRKVVTDFQRVLPSAKIYVYDNNSTDNTAFHAVAAGAIVRTETLQGKGYVVRRMFADIDADLYILVDGDDTYEAQAVTRMIEMMLTGPLDMVTAVRQSQNAEAYRLGHQTGNAVLTGAVRLIFGARVQDVFSGYRAFSRRFVKSFPALATGFETETEFTVYALELHMAIGDLNTSYGARPEGSISKLHTIRDGIRVVRTIADLIRSERPLQFFSALASFLFMLSLLFGVPVISEFVRTGLVPRFPTAILAVGLMQLSFLSLACGLILDSVARGRCEVRRLAYLALPPVTSFR